MGFTAIWVQEEERWPLAAPAQRRLRSVLLNQTDLRGRRLTGSFQLCALCTCCGGPRGLCLPSPCCYAINCNIPNRPFGFCSFTPKTCNCFGWIIPRALTEEVTKETNEIMDENNNRQIIDVGIELRDFLKQRRLGPALRPCYPKDRSGSKLCYCIYALFWRQE
ncbi:hypothetical protein ACMD2_18325 [Ananas comosus]|uniref:DUF7866 domain-containing protein n=1 Tax=Ananas comosus TaxID=4615 RepID=A0A199VSW1_ANACO|nr:hypothetical protein ACMD2_18325 [Ananas comosus]